jgi:hypothetical protein
VPRILGFSDEYLPITNFTHKDGPNISARSRTAPNAKTIFYPLKKLLSVLFYSTAMEKVNSDFHIPSHASSAIEPIKIAPGIFKTSLFPIPSIKK